MGRQFAGASNELTKVELLQFLENRDYLVRAHCPKIRARVPIVHLDVLYVSPQHADNRPEPSASFHLLSLDNLGESQAFLNLRSGRADHTEMPDGSETKRAAQSDRLIRQPSAYQNRSNKKCNSPVSGLVEKRPRGRPPDSSVSN